MASVAQAAIGKGDTARARAIVEQLEANRSFAVTREEVIGALALTKALITIGDKPGSTDEMLV
jgi:ATP-dependent protease Clp ATPase subunit